MENHHLNESKMKDVDHNDLIGAKGDYMKNRNNS